MAVDILMLVERYDENGKPDTKNIKAENMQRHKTMTGAGKPRAVDGISRTPAVKPQRNRAKPEAPKAGKPETDEADSKKTVVPRRAPTRGKYIDEYAGPAA